MTEFSEPAFVRYFGPVLSALDPLWGSARPAEVREQTVRDLSISEDEQSELIASGSPRFDRMATASSGTAKSAARIDALAAKVGAAVERLEDLRTALVSAATTGTFYVREAVA